MKRAWGVASLVGRLVALELSLGLFFLLAEVAAEERGGTENEDHQSGHEDEIVHLVKRSGYLAGLILPLTEENLEFNTLKGGKMGVVTVVLARLVVASLAVIITRDIPEEDASMRTRGLKHCKICRCMLPDFKDIYK